MNAPASLRRSLHRVRHRGAAGSGVEAIDIGWLVSPLRYDVLVRAQFFEFLEDNLDLFQRDFAEFARLAREHPYFGWCQRVAAVRHHPRIAADRSLLLAYYEDRLRRSYALWTSFRRTGFDRRHPLLLRAARPGAGTDSGKMVSRPLYVGDGCHRLALLLASGTRLLPPGYYRVDRRVLATVPDNTARLLGPLGVTETDYAGFLSLGYADRRLPDLAALLEHVEERRPALLTELRGVIAHDRPLLAPV